MSDLAIYLLIDNIQAGSILGKSVPRILEYDSKKIPAIIYLLTVNVLERFISNNAYKLQLEQTFKCNIELINDANSEITKNALIINGHPLAIIDIILFLADSGCYNNNIGNNNVFNPVSYQNNSVNSLNQINRQNVSNNYYDQNAQFVLQNNLNSSNAPIFQDNQYNHYKSTSLNGSMHGSNGTVANFQIQKVPTPTNVDILATSLDFSRSTCSPNDVFGSPRSDKNGSSCTADYEADQAKSEKNGYLSTADFESHATKIDESKPNDFSDYAHQLSLLSLLNLDPSEQSTSSINNLLFPHGLDSPTGHSPRSGPTNIITAGSHFQNSSNFFGSTQSDDNHSFTSGDVSVYNRSHYNDSESASSNGALDSQMHQLYLNNAQIGAVMGEKGSIIRQIRNMSCAQVKISSISDRPEDLRLCVVSGNPHNVQVALKLIRQRLNTLVIDAPSAQRVVPQPQYQQYSTYSSNYTNSSGYQTNNIPALRTPTNGSNWHNNIGPNFQLNNNIGPNFQSNSAQSFPTSNFSQQNIMHNPSQYVGNDNRSFPINAAFNHSSTSNRPSQMTNKSPLNIDSHADNLHLSNPTTKKVPFVQLRSSSTTRNNIDFAKLYNATYQTGPNANQ